MEQKDPKQNLQNDDMSEASEKDFDEQKRKKKPTLQYYKPPSSRASNENATANLTHFNAQLNANDNQTKVNN